MENIIRAINNALDLSGRSLTWYGVTGDYSYMVECKEYINEANKYINQLCEEENSNVMSN